MNLDYYLLVIDTNRYAGNFEREMCAYITGQIGDCAVGKKQAERAKQEIPQIISTLEDLIEQVPDDHGCRRPVSIFPNPRYGNDGHGKHAVLTAENKDKFSWPAYYSVAIYFHTLPQTEVLKILEERALKFAQQEEHITIEGFRLLEKHTVYKEI